MKFFKKIVSLAFFIIVSYNAKTQSNISKYYFDIVKNAENCSGGFEDTIIGLTLRCDFYNKDNKIGKGRRILFIHKSGGLYLDSIGRIKYPTNIKYETYGDAYIKNLLNKNKKELIDFNIYFERIAPERLKKTRKYDGEAGCDKNGVNRGYIDYEEQFPCYKVLFKKEAGKNYFVAIDSVQYDNEKDFLYNDKKNDYLYNKYTKPEIERINKNYKESKQMLSE